MKKSLKPILLSLILLCFLAFSQVGLAMAPNDPPPPPQPPSNHGQSGNQGESPIDGGVLVSLAMVAGYGAYKWLKVVQKKSQTAND